MLSNLFYLNELGKRKNLEDHIFPGPGAATVKDQLFIVCDGVGGLSKGEEASRIVCETIGNRISSLKGQPIKRAQIEDAATEALANMKNYANEDPLAEQMSTTLTFVYLQTDGVWASWCGDSRIYHIRDGRVLWRSKDHSLVQQLIDSGEISEEGAKTHPQKNIILRSLSASSDKVPIDTHFITDLQANDYILLCSDGVLEQVDEAALFNILSANSRQKDKRKLILEYCEGKTNDNFSMYLLEMGRNSKADFKSRLALILLVAVVFAIALFLILDKKDGLNKTQINSKVLKPSDSRIMKKAAPKRDTNMLKLLENKMKKGDSKKMK